MVKSIAEELLEREIQYFEDNDEIASLERAQKELALIRSLFKEEEGKMERLDG